MRAGAAVALALAVLAGDAAAEDAPSLLEQELGARLTGTSVKPKEKARVFWARRGGAPVKIKEGVSLAPRIADSSTARIRARVRGDDVDLAVYFDESDLERVAVRTAVARPARANAASRDFTDRTPGIHLAPGAVVTLIRELGILAELSVSGEISGRGYAPRVAVSFEFKPGPAHQWSGDSVMFSERIVVRDQPGGAVVATIAAESWGVVLERRDSHSLIACKEGEVAAVGWVPNARLGAAILGGLSGFGIGGGGTGWASSVTLRPGTPLRPSRNGAVVGVIRRQVQVELIQRVGRWIKVRIESPLGDLELWVRR